MNTYNFLSKIVLAREKYALKFFLVTTPLVVLAISGVVVAMYISNGAIGFSLPLFVAIFIGLIIAYSLLTLYLFSRLLTPLRVAVHALDEYVGHRTIPEFPATGNDEAGALLSNIQSTINQLEKLIVEKSDMVDLLSHDVRSPVGRILSLSSLIKMDDATEKDGYADYITNECTGLLSMLENILLILKEDNHVLRLDFIKLDTLVQETLSFFNFAVAEKNLQVLVSVDSSIYIHVQAQLFRQAVRNIIGNAIKFSPDGKTITITGTQTSEQISLSIRDQGLGLKANDINKIFERFTTAGKRGTHGEASTGLGLYLSKKIVEKHGGKLEASSDGENKGAVFTITFYRLIIKKPQDKVIKAAPRRSVVAIHRR